MRLFTYCIPVDDGAAPNPYWGICTLAICKPVIRRTANVGDWVVGLGSKNVNGIDYSKKVVYAMKITKKMTLKEYDLFCSEKLRNKIPDIYNNEYSRQVGDCIYDFSFDSEGVIRPGVHNNDNRSTDLGGKNVLLSDHFYYFGDQAVPLPPELHPIIKQGQGHQSYKNERYIEAFVEWIVHSGYRPNTLYGDPQIILKFEGAKMENKCAQLRCKSNIQDENEFETATYERIAKSSFKTKLDIYLYWRYLHDGLSNISLDYFSNFKINDEIVNSYAGDYWQSDYDDIIKGQKVADIEKDIQNWQNENKGIISVFQTEYIKFWKQKIFPKNVFNELMSGDKCPYCNISIDEIYELSSKRQIFKKNFRGWKLEIDRKKPNYEYSPENCVLACYWCNNAKTDEFTEAEFLPIAQEIRKVWNKRIQT